MGYRIGIDVGGTFTKAALVATDTSEVVARSTVLTTHADPRGVAAGVVEVFARVLAAARIDPADVGFIAHSTTQATNALLEGDVATVGIVAMATTQAASLARPQAEIAPIELVPGRWLRTANRFLVSDTLTDAAIEDAVTGLVADGADVLVASAAFGVDDTGTEERVRRIGARHALPTTCGHEISRLYGLTVRTRTAVVNASILPKMIATADLTAASVRDAGVSAPLMVMRGDGGAMDIREMRRRPAVTMLSGPAASVAGVLMHLKVSDGIYFEVGGTSTNIAVIKGGRPAVAYARIGGHPTYVTSLDVRVLGVAGGSLIRADANGIVDVGPRSAHIAGLPYAAFAEPSDLAGAVVEPFEPQPGDHADHIAIRTASGRRFALTTTCAANALGLTDSSMHAHANAASARSAFAALAAYLGADPETVARSVLEAAAGKLVPVVEDLIREHDLDPDQQVLLAVGGGAGALAPYTARRLERACVICRDAEIISSIGAALAMVREVVERVVPHPTPADLAAMRREALEAAVAMGAVRDTVDVTIEIDRLTHRVRATASGSTEMRTGTEAGVIVEPEARGIAARSLGVPSTALSLAAEMPGFRVYVATPSEPHPVRIVDHTGRIRTQRSRALVRGTVVPDLPSRLSQLWDDAVATADDPAATPDLILLVGHHLADLSGVETKAQALALAASEVDGVDPSSPITLVALPR
jgi:N-methylhydantoinase A/oxoprolinase/acetone carboxylase beta subunit